MPSKKKKYNARFPASRIKKIMQTDEEVGKVAQAVPVIISRTLELFVESLLIKSMQITQSRNAKTLTQSHMKQCILSESRFDFLKDLVKDIPDASTQEDNENNAQDCETPPPKTFESPHGTSNNVHDTVRSEIAANFYTEQSSSRTPVIQYGPNVTERSEQRKVYTNKSRVKPDEEEVGKNPDGTSTENVPSLIPISQNMYGQSTGDSLYIDEDYDN